MCAEHRYRLASVKCDTPVLILPLSGTKNVNHGSRSFSAGIGQYLMIHRAMDVSMENIPAPDQPYVAGVLGFPWRVIGLARQIILNREHAASNKPGDCDISCSPISPSVSDAVHAHLRLMQRSPTATQIDHGLLGILIALHEDNASGFLLADNPSLSARIRLMVGSQPERDWSSIDFEDAFHMSGATLRRRVAEENTNLRTLIREARLQCALALLQTTRKTLTKIAEESGYRSLPSFRKGFIAQFGVDPAAVANN